jgi:hypothetical protein
MATPTTSLDLVGNTDSRPILAAELLGTGLPWYPPTALIHLEEGVPRFPEPQRISGILVNGSPNETWLEQEDRESKNLVIWHAARKDHNAACRQKRERRQRRALGLQGDLALVDGDIGGGLIEVDNIPETVLVGPVKSTAKAIPKTSQNVLPAKNKGNLNVKVARGETGKEVKQRSELDKKQLRGGKNETLASNVGANQKRGMFSLVSGKQSSPLISRQGKPFLHSSIEMGRCAFKATYESLFVFIRASDNAFAVYL